MLGIFRKTNVTLKSRKTFRGPFPAVFVMAALLIISGCGGGGGSSSSDSSSSNQSTTETNSIYDLSVANDANNALRLVVSWKTTIASGGYVEYRQADSADWLSTPASSVSSTGHSIVVAGLRDSTSYVVRPVSDGLIGGETTIATKALPSSFPSTSITTSSSLTPFSDITIGGFPYPISSIAAVDSAGKIIWYHVDSDQSDPSGFAIGLDNRLIYQIPSAIKAVDYGGNEEVLLDLNSTGETSHHDFQQTDDGHFMYLTRTKVSSGGKEYCADKIMERDSTGKLYWEWNSADHADELGGLVVSNLSQSREETGCGLDWSHANSIQLYTSAGGLKYVFVSLRNLNRILKIDYGTKKILWQLGEGLSFTYTGSESSELQWFKYQHSARFLDDGTMLLFDNGNERYSDQSLNFSRASIYQVDETNMRTRLLWEFDFKLFATQSGNVRKLSNGNILITFPTTSDYSTSMFVEADKNEQLLWETTMTYPSSQATNMLLGNVRAASIYDLKASSTSKTATKKK